MAEMIAALPDNVYRLTQQACCCKPTIVVAGCHQLNGTAQRCVGTFSERHRHGTDRQTDWPIGCNAQAAFWGRAANNDNESRFYTTLYLRLLFCCTVFFVTRYLEYLEIIGSFFKTSDISSVSDWPLESSSCTWDLCEADAAGLSRTDCPTVYSSLSCINTMQMSVLWLYQVR